MYRSEKKFLAMNRSPQQISRPSVCCVVAMLAAICLARNDAVAARDFANRFQEAGYGLEHALERLDDYRGEFARVPLDDGDGALGVVERRHQHLVADARRYAR